VKIVRYGSLGSERPGLLDSTGRVRDLSVLISDWTPAYLSPVELGKISRVEVESLPLVPGVPRFGVPVDGIGKFIGVGMNYTDFAREAQRPTPKEPALFTKAVSCLTGPDDDVMLPLGSVKTDWEVELGVIIGRTARYVEEAEALSYVAGYCLVNDISEREYQNDRGGTWDKGKGCDTFGPVGPWLVTPDELSQPQDLRLWLEVNGVRYQDGHTRNMFFTVAQLVAYISRFMTLKPGDLIATGTPAGVGMSIKPEPMFLRAMDTMRLGCTQLGMQQHRVVPWRRVVSSGAA
jgi:2,4-didehydro-3-deoxy-L-rhamnonate hydrolase